MAQGSCASPHTTSVALICHILSVLTALQLLRQVQAIYCLLAETSKDGQFFSAAVETPAGVVVFAF